MKIVQHVKWCMKQTKLTSEVSFPKDLVRIIEKLEWPKASYGLLLYPVIFSWKSIILILKKPSEYFKFPKCKVQRRLANKRKSTTHSFFLRLIAVWRITCKLQVSIAIRVFPKIDYFVRMCQNWICWIYHWISCWIKFLLKIWQKFGKALVK